MIAGIAQVRNEEHIIADAVEHFLGFCDRLYIYDDVSTDSTVDILSLYPDVHVKVGSEWITDRSEAERANRQLMLEQATADGAEWICTFDADERIELPEQDWRQFDGVRMKLFDFYITPKDVDWNYKDRKWMGPEYREIYMLYRNGPNIRFNHHGQRDMWMNIKGRTLDAGYVKHYGKAISVEEWEDTCHYYVTYFGEPYRTKWANRRGKAIHTVSDFGNPLITWEQRQTHGIPMP